MCPLLLGLLLAGCAATTQDGEVNPGADGGGGGVADMRVGPNPDAFWASDPPLMMCGADGVPKPPATPPGGTPECPDDKNREGCPCDTPGATAKCWPGLRANRNLGICMDGTATCMAGEVTNTWGPCKGYVLPAAGATSGKDACQCFSQGKWLIDNLKPCILYGPAKNTCTTINNCAAGEHCVDFNGTKNCRVAGAGGAISTIVNGGVAQCPSDISKVPTQPWSSNSLQIDCQGTFELCYELKAGDIANPQAADCTLAKSCTKGTYNQSGGQSQSFDPLPPWISTDAAGQACALRWEQIGGYGEMTVNGKSITCDQVGPRRFNRVKYCPGKCVVAPLNPETRPECQNCFQGGGGTF